MLVVIQGMDTSGKGGVLKHAVVDARPRRGAGGVVQEADRGGARARLPLAGREAGPGTRARSTIFDRSHYEDVLIARVHELAPEEEIERRYDAINDFETTARRGRHHDRQADAAHLQGGAARPAAQAARRVPTKLWKFKPEDVDERQRWDEYQTAYEIALERCNTEWAPWYVVPSDRKWYRTLAIASLAARHARVDGPRLAGARLRRRGAEGAGSGPDGSAEEQPDRDVHRLADVGGARAAGHPLHEAGQPHVADHLGDRDLVLGGLVVRRRAASGSAIARISSRVTCMPTTWISVATEASANMKARVSASVRFGSRCSERVARPSTYMTRSCGVSPGIDAAVHAGVGLLELAAQRGDEQVDLRGEVAVERAEGDVGPLGDGPHLHGVEAALRGQGDRRVEDPLAALALRGRPEVVVGQGVERCSSGWPPRACADAGSAPADLPLGYQRKRLESKHVPVSPRSAAPAERS